MKLFLRILKWTALSVISIVVLGFLYLFFIYFAAPDKVAKADEATDREWHTVPFKGNTMCSDGSEFAIYVRKGTSKNVMIHFSGGGACWDDTTCANPISLKSIFDGNSRNLKSFYLSSLLRFFPKALSGIADNDNPTNAFHDWTIVFIPYCTGDLHIGNVTTTYTYEGKKFKIHHNGRNNSLAALNWVFSNFKEADKILVSGESAGAYASAFWTPFVADHYSGKKIYQLSDGALLSSKRWKDILDNVWKSESEVFMGFQIDKDIFEDALLNRTDSVKRNIKYLHSNSAYDDVLTDFSAALNHTPTNSNRFIDDWSANTRASMNRLSQSGLDYNYFISDWGYNAAKHGTQHTMTTNAFYYNMKADGITYAEWLKKNIIDDKPLSLGKKLIEKK